MQETLALFAGWLQVKEVVTIKDMTAIFVATMPVDTIKVFRTYGISTSLLKHEFEKHMESVENAEYKDKKGEKANVVETQKFKLPEQFKGFVKNLNEQLAGTTCDILGRDRECKLVWQTMLKNTKKNVVLTGEPGVGKTSIVEKITYDIISGNCPEEFKDFTVLSLDVTSSVAGTQYRGQAEERYSAFADSL